MLPNFSTASGKCRASLHLHLNPFFGNVGDQGGTSLRTRQVQGCEAVDATHDFVPSAPALTLGPKVILPPEGTFPL